MYTALLLPGWYIRATSFSLFCIGTGKLTNTKHKKNKNYNFYHENLLVRNMVTVQIYRIRGSHVGNHDNFSLIEYKSLVVYWKLIDVSEEHDGSPFRTEE
jgi:hypothetical protein